VTDSKPLIATRCSACETVYFPPRKYCVSCGSNPETEQLELSGKGTLYSFTNVHLGAIAPAGVGYVDLEEGVRALARFEMHDEPSKLVGTNPPVRISYGEIGTDTEDVVLGWLEHA
jgi:uncharacterized protein